ncbi:MAG TPA: Rieske 2Fe-2S domain-containing protein [Usitatibacter sp.]|jgi:nitrite reductase/ring-hydroxylating ferredoxin subunit|nr:Rieske 2Fe-2S domain-containing protein [Usitatibacter sp.]
MAREPRVICASADLAEAGKGVRFTLAREGGEEKGFAVRHAGKVRGYVNRCPHMGTELDWQPGEFFEEGGLYLVCSTHGAIFEPGNGFCAAGPCRGASLEPLEVREQDGQILLLNDDP